MNQLFKLAGGGARHGNVTTSYTVLYLSASVPGRGGLAVFLGRALSCPFWERCRILMAVEGRGLGLPGASRVSFLWLLSPLSPFWGAVYLPGASALRAVPGVGFSVPAGKCICRLWANWRPLGVLFLTVSCGVVVPLHVKPLPLSRVFGLSVFERNLLCVVAEWVGRFCRESVSRRPAPCEALCRLRAACPAKRRDINSGKFR